MTEQKQQPTEWFALEVTAASYAAEAIEFAMNELDCLGSEVNSLKKKPGEDLTIAGYFEQEIDHETVEEAISFALQVHGLQADSIRGRGWRRIGQTDWLFDWKQHWKPTTIGRFVVSPPWERVEDAERHIIYIEPNMAFGTGTHATTQLCIEAIGEIYRPGETLFDVGTGTGILAIAAAKMNAAEGQEMPRLVGCDLDVGSIDIARDNAGLNEVGEAIDFYVGSITKESEPADLVVANLTIDVIKPLLDLLLSKTNSTLILSGVLTEQTDELEQELERREINNAEIRTSGEWIAAIIRKT